MYRSPIRHAQLLSYLNPASNRTKETVSEERRPCSNISQLLSWNWVFCLTSKFNASLSLRICPSLLHPVVSVVGPSPCTLPSSSGWWNCFSLHVDPCSSLPTFISESFHFLCFNTWARTLLCFGIQRIDFHVWARRQFFKTSTRSV